MQQLVVILIVAAAALSAAWRLMGVATRLWVLEALARVLGQPEVLRRRVRRLQAAQFQKGGCGSCAQNKSR